MLRLFFALQPPLEQSLGIAEQVAPLIARVQGQRVPAENLHATLCFIGAVEDGGLESLMRAAAQVGGPSLSLRFDALDHWREPRILCATAAEESGTEAARELAGRLGKKTTAAGFHPDLKPFRPHLTLARKVDARRAMQDVWPRALMPALRVRFDRFVLMRSDRSESGSIYSVVASWPLDTA